MDAQLVNHKERRSTPSMRIKSWRKASCGMSVIPCLQGKSRESLWAQEQPCLCSEFQTNQGCIVKPCLKIVKTKQYGVYTNQNGVGYKEQTWGSLLPSAPESWSGIHRPGFYKLKRKKKKEWKRSQKTSYCCVDSWLVRMHSKLSVIDPLSHTIQLRLAMIRRRVSVS